MQAKNNKWRLILVTSSGGLLTQFKVLGSLETEMLLCLARFAFQTQDNLTCSLCLFVENRLGLSTETHLLTVVSTLSLGKVGSLTRLVLRHLVNGVLLALSGTVCSTFFRYIHHFIH